MIYVFDLPSINLVHGFNITIREDLKDEARNGRLYTGPFLVTRKIGPVNVVLQQSRKSKPFVVHIDKIKECYGETPKNWTTNNEDDEDEKKQKFLQSLTNWAVRI